MAGMGISTAYPFSSIYLNGVRELMNSCLSVQSNPTLSFLPSEGTVNDVGSETDVINREQIHTDWNGCQGLDCTQSKLLTEWILRPQSSKPASNR